MGDRNCGGAEARPWPACWRPPSGACRAPANEPSGHSPRRTRRVSGRGCDQSSGRGRTQRKGENLGAMAVPPGPARLSSPQTPALDPDLARRALGGRWSQDRFEAIEQMQRALGEHLVVYNTKRPPQRRGMNGRTLLDGFQDGIGKATKKGVKTGPQVAASFHHRQRQPTARYQHRTRHAKVCTPFTTGAYLAAGGTVGLPLS